MTIIIDENKEGIDIEKLKKKRQQEIEEMRKYNQDLYK